MNDANNIMIYTDGACSGNPGKGGWGCVILFGDSNCPEREIEMSGGEKSTTNNRMELMAAIQGLTRVAVEISAVEISSGGISSGGASNSSAKITLITDSQYVKNGITTWINGWKKNGWKTANKQPVKNQDLWIKLDELNTTLSVNWDWVKGHAGNKYNEICDKLATTAASLQ
mgnify:CR=1 FL=1